MNAYSEDLRQKIVEAVHRGTPKSEVARLLGVSLSSVKRYARLAREGKPLAPRKAPGKRPKIGERARRLLEADLEERPAGTLEERRRFLERVAGVRVSESTVSRMLKRLGWTRKKIDGRERTGRVVEGALAGADRPRGGRPEAGFRRRVRHAHLVGAALRLGTPGRTGSRAGAAQSRQEHDALGEHDGRRDGPLHGAVVGSTTTAVLEAYVEQVLAPALRPGQIVVMDNLAAHKGERVRELVEGRGCGLSYLPPYSPDLNPIEEAFSKVKISLRRAGARTREALVEAMGRALDAVTPQDARGFFKHCGYGLRGQSL